MALTPYLRNPLDDTGASAVPRNPLDAGNPTASSGAAGLNTSTVDPMIGLQALAGRVQAQREATATLRPWQMPTSAPAYYNPATGQIAIGDKVMASDDYAGLLATSQQPMTPSAPPSGGQWQPLSETVISQMVGAIQNPTNSTLFKKGFESGTASLANLYGNFAQFATGGRVGGNLVADTEATMARLAPFQRRVEDIRSPSDAAGYAAAVFGQLGPSALESAAVALAGAGIGAVTAGPAAPVGAVTGGVGGLVGKAAIKKALKEAVERISAAKVAGVAAEAADEVLVRAAAAAVAKGAATGAKVGIAANSSIMGMGDVYQEMVGQGMDMSAPENIAKVFFGGLAYGALDYIPEAMLFGRLFRGVPAAALSGTVGNRARQLLMRGAKGGVQFGALEGGTEAGQDLITLGASGQDLTSPEARSRLLNSFAAGALGGGVPGALTSLRATNVLDPGAPAEQGPALLALPAPDTVINAGAPAPQLLLPGPYSNPDAKPRSYYDSQPSEAPSYYDGQGAAAAFQGGFDTAPGDITGAAAAAFQGGQPIDRSGPVAGYQANRPPAPGEQYDLFPGRSDGVAPARAYGVMPEGAVAEPYQQELPFEEGIPPPPPTPAPVNTQLQEQLNRLRLQQEYQAAVAQQEAQKEADYDAALRQAALDQINNEPVPGRLNPDILQALAERTARLMVDTAFNDLKKAYPQIYEGTVLTNEHRLRAAALLMDGTYDKADTAVLIALSEQLAKSEAKASEQTTAVETEVQPVAAKPVAAKPVAAKPVAAKPVAAKPAAAKPVAESPGAKFDIEKAAFESSVIQKSAVTLPNPNKSWKGGPLAKITVYELDDDRWTTGVSVTNSRGGFGRPADKQSTTFESKEAALVAAANEILRNSPKTPLTNADKAIKAWAEDIVGKAAPKPAAAKPVAAKPVAAKPAAAKPAAAKPAAAKAATTQAKLKAGNKPKAEDTDTQIPRKTFSAKEEAVPAAKPVPEAKDVELSDEAKADIIQYASERLLPTQVAQVLTLLRGYDDVPPLTATQANNLIDRHVVVLDRKALNGEAVTTLDEQLTSGDRKAIAREYGHKEFNSASLLQFASDFADVMNGLGQGVSKVIGAIVKRIQAAAMSLVLVFNPVALEPARIQVPTAVVRMVDIKDAVPAAAAARMSPEAKAVYESVAHTAKATGKGFIIADKPSGMVFAFGSDGNLIADGAALYGKTAGDVRPADLDIQTITDAGKITPAGTFRAKFVAASDYAGGKVLFLTDTTTGAYAGGNKLAVAIHAVYTKDAAENRVGRLNTAEATDNKVSFGCINTSNELFLNEVLPRADEFDGGLVFVLPDNVANTDSLFPVSRASVTERVSDTAVEKTPTQKEPVLPAGRYKPLQARLRRGRGRKRSGGDTRNMQRLIPIEPLPDVESEVKGMSMPALTLWLHDNASNDIQRQLAVIIRNAVLALKKQGIALKFEVVGDNDTRLDEGASGNARVTDTEATILVRSGLGTNYETIAHELLHVATLRGVKDGRLSKNKLTTIGKAVADLDKLHAALVARYESRKAAGTLTAAEKLAFESSNFLENADEVIAWGMTDPEAINYLHSVPYDAKRTAFNKFIEIISGLLGIHYNNQTMYAELSRIVESITNYEVASGMAAKRGTASANMSRGPLSAPWANAPAAMQDTANAMRSVFVGNPLATKAAAALAMGNQLMDLAKHHGIKSVDKLMEVLRDRNAVAASNEASFVEWSDSHAKLTEKERGVGPGSVSNLIEQMTRQDRWAFIPEYLAKEHADAKENINLDDDLAAAYNALSKEGKAFVQQAFKLNYDMLRKTKDAILTTVASEFDAMLAVVTDPDEKKKIESDKKASLTRFTGILSINPLSPYAPLTRYGNYVVVGRSDALLKAMAKGDHALAAKLELDGDHYFVDYADSWSQAQAMRQRVAARYGDAAKNTQAFERNKSQDEMFGGGDMMYAYQKMISRLGELDGGSKLRNQATQMMLEAMSVASSRKGELRRRNISSDPIDMVKAITSRGRASSRFLAAIHKNAEVIDAMAKMEKETKNPNAPGREYRQIIYNTILERHLDTTQVRPQNDIADVVTGYTSFWMLATSPSYFLQQLLQNHVIALPMIAAEHGYVKATKALSAGYSTVQKAWGDSGVTGRLELNKLDRNMRPFAEFLAESGALDVGLNTDIGRATAGSENVVSGTLNKVLDTLRNLMRKIESINRLSSGWAVYKLELDRINAGGAMKRNYSAGAYKSYLEQVQITNPGAATLSEAEFDAAHTALRLVVDSHGDYAMSNTPMFMRGATGRVLFQFQKFRVIITGLYVREFHNAFFNKNMSKQERAVARKTVMFLAGHAAIMAGMLGSPFFAVFAGLYNMASGDEDDRGDLERDLRQAIGNETIADLLLRGAPSLAGVDMSGTLGQANLLSVAPYADMPTDRDKLGAFMLAMLGPAIGGVLPSAVDGLGLMGQGDFYRGLEKLMPRGVGAASKTMRERFTGEVNTRGDMLTQPVGISAIETMWGTLGLQPIDRVRRSFVRSEAFKDREFYAARASDLKRQYVSASEAGNAAKMSALRKDWQELQAARAKRGFKTQPVTSLIKAPAEKALRERRTASGVQYTPSTQGQVEQLAEMVGN